MCLAKGAGSLDGRAWGAVSTCAGDARVADGIYKQSNDEIAKLVGVTKNSVTLIRNKSYWNYNNLNAKDPVAMNLFTQKDLVLAIEKAERRIKREKKEKEKTKLSASQGS